MSLFGFGKAKQVNEPPPPQNRSTSQLPFEAYKGSKPYIFISYAHADSAMVYPIIKEFHEYGYHVWYDEGIEPGIAWPEEIAKALGGCSLFVVFITPRSTKSDNVDNEIYVALAKKKPVIAIYLEPTVLTPGQELQFGKRQAIKKYDMDEQAFRRKYTYSFESTPVKTGMHTQIPIPVSNAAILEERETPRESGQAAVPDTPRPQTPPPAEQNRQNAALDLFVPKGTAKITMSDGRQYTAIANTLTAHLKKNGNYLEYLYRQLDDKASLPGSSDEIVVFEDLCTLSISRSADGMVTLATCTDFDNKVYIKEISDIGAEFWCITGNEQTCMTKIPVKDILEIVFDYQSAPDYSIPMTLIERSVSKSLLVPRASIVAQIRVSSNRGGAPSFPFVDSIPLEMSGELPFRRIRTLTVDRVMKEPKMYSPDIEAALSVVKKNGETFTDRIKACYTLFSLTSSNIITPDLSSIIRIRFDYE